MRHQLRELTDRSVSSLRNFFTGFLTLEELKKEAGQPLRKVRPLVTKDSLMEEVAVVGGMVPERQKTRAELDEEAERLNNPVLTA